MSTRARRRLIKDLQKIRDDPNPGVSAAPHENDFLLWDAVIFGPVDTPYEDGAFRCELRFTEDYPNKPPKIKFLTRMFHPNIYNDGSICLDVLDSKWSATFDVSGILTSIQSLLDEPNVDSPANARAAKMYTESRNEYNRVVRQTVEESWVVDQEFVRNLPVT